jgi:hypothetical protein
MHIPVQYEDGDSEYFIDIESLQEYQLRCYELLGMFIMI